MMMALRQFLARAPGLVREVTMRSSSRLQRNEEMRARERL